MSNYSKMFGINKYSCIFARKELGNINELKLHVMTPIAGQIKIETESGIDVFELTFKKHIPYSKLQSQNTQKYKALSDKNAALNKENEKLIREAKKREKSASKFNLERTFFIVTLVLLASFITVLILTK